MRKNRLWVLALAGVLVVPNSFAQFADAVVSYVPGAGVGASYTNATAALGEPSRITAGQWGEPVTPFSPPWQSEQIVSVGAGGSLTLHLDPPATNNPMHPFGVDFILFGNAGFVITNGNYAGGGITDGALFGHNDGSTRVSVSADGVTFYTLNAALAPTVGGLFPTDGGGNFFAPVNPALRGSDFTGLGLAGIGALYAGSGGGPGYDLAWAQDTHGQSVALAAASFIRIEVLSGKSEIDGVALVEPMARILQEDFADSPPAHGWSIFGNSNLFRWNVTDQNLEVTWDSSQSNSYFQLPLGTLLTRRDDFSVALDLRLNDITGGVKPDKPSTFPLAFGFQNAAKAQGTNFFRGTGLNSPNLVEFNFFPDTGFGPTVWPAVWSTNSSLNYNGPTDYTILDLPVGVVMRIVLTYTGSDETLVTSITTNGIQVGAINPVQLGTNFTALRVNTFAIESYSDAGQEPGFAGSLLARGVMDNIIITGPPPPVRDHRGALAGGVWQSSFLSRTNWNYVLEATENLRSWSDVTAPLTGTGGLLTLQDANTATQPHRFYRVKAVRPD